jgi:NADPH:quinone reductase-like Zn-dependent oxidoreductase
MADGKAEEKKQKAAVFDDYGESKVLRVVSVPVLEPGEAEIQIAVKAAGVNPADFKIRAGMWRSYPIKFPCIPGWDVAGVVTKVGHAARRFKVGDAVYGYVRRPVYQHGTYCEYLTAPESYFAKKPQKANFHEAAGIPLAGLTSYQALKDHGELKEGQSVIILGASGGTGSFAVQFARAMKAKVVIGVASAANAEYVSGLGATHALDYKSDLVAEVKKILPEGADLVYDCFGGDTVAVADRLLKSNGRLVCIAKLKNPTPKEDLWFKNFLVDPNSVQLEELTQLYDKGVFTCKIEKVYKLAEAAKAHDDIASFHTKGKIVIDPTVE